MKQTIQKYSLYGLLLSLSLFTITFYAGKGTSYDFQEFLGYASIVLSLLMIYPAMRHYHSHHPTDRSYLTYLIIGLAITFAVAVGATIADYIYVTVLYPDFVTDYTQHMLDELATQYSGAELTEQKAQLLAQIEKMGSPMVMVGFMFVTVMIIGIIFSLLMSLWMSSRAPQL